MNKTVVVIDVNKLIRINLLDFNGNRVNLNWNALYELYDDYPNLECIVIRVCTLSYKEKPTSNIVSVCNTIEEVFDEFFDTKIECYYEYYKTKTHNIMKFLSTYISDDITEEQVEFINNL